MDPLHVLEYCGGINATFLRLEGLLRFQRFRIGVSIREAFNYLVLVVTCNSGSQIAPAAQLQPGKSKNPPKAGNNMTPPRNSIRLVRTTFYVVKY